MMSNTLLLFVLGFVWLFGLAIQTIAMSRKGRMYVETAIVVFLLSIVWVVIVKKLAVYNSVTDAISYAVGTVLGALLGKYMIEKYEDKSNR